MDAFSQKFGMENKVYPEDMMPLTAKGNKILRSMEKTYPSEEKAKEVLYASKNAGKITGIDADCISRITDAVGALSRRFDAIVARKDAEVSPSEYKRLVKERDEAQQQLIDFSEAVKKGANWNLGVFEKKYTAASEALAKAQVKMSKGWG
jgi:hypothetical protein